MAMLKRPLIATNAAQDATALARRRPDFFRRPGSIIDLDNLDGRREFPSISLIESA
jgi:hypothetical protein